MIVSHGLGAVPDNGISNHVPDFFEEDVRVFRAVVAAGDGLSYDDFDGSLPDIKRPAWHQIEAIDDGDGDNRKLRCYGKHDAAFFEGLEPAVPAPRAFAEEKGADAVFKLKGVPVDGLHRFLRIRPVDRNHSPQLEGLAHDRDLEERFFYDEPEGRGKGRPYGKAVQVALVVGDEHVGFLLADVFHSLNPDANAVGNEDEPRPDLAEPVREPPGPVHQG